MMAMTEMHRDGCVAIRREGRFLVAELLRPHRVLSSAIVGGGWREDLRFVVDYQICEGRGHAAIGERLHRVGHETYHTETCAELGVDPAATILLATAANMSCAAVERRAYEEIAAVCCATAGADGNATRAGDPARWHERGPAASTPAGGTIVTCAFVNRPCTPGCLTAAAAVITEAKTAALLARRIPSRQSSRLATGTGTDQFAIASPLPADADDWERRWSGAHHRLGECLGAATTAAVGRSLEQQGANAPTLRRSVLVALGRFGLDEERLFAVWERVLDPERSRLARDNWRALVHDPQAAAAAFAMAEVNDLVADGLLPAEAGERALRDQAALLAATIAWREDAFASLRVELDDGDGDAADLAARALACGLRVRWQRD